MTAHIIEIDMHIRDERVLNYILLRVRSGDHQLSHDEIAEVFKCHRHTVAAIVRRLESAGHIAVDKESKRGGYCYAEVTHDQRDRLTG